MEIKTTRKFRPADEDLLGPMRRAVADLLDHPKALQEDYALAAWHNYADQTKGGDYKGFNAEMWQFSKNRAITMLSDNNGLTWTEILIISKLIYQALIGIKIAVGTPVSIRIPDLRKHSEKIQIHWIDFVLAVMVETGNAVNILPEVLDGANEAASTPYQNELIRLMHFVFQNTIKREEENAEMDHP